MSLKLCTLFPEALDVHLKGLKSTVFKQELKLLKVNLPKCKKVHVVDSLDTLQ